MRKKISFAGPWITEKEINYVTEAAAKGWYENYDKYMKGFEEEVRNYLGVKYAIGTHCCTQALHLASEAIGLKEGDEVNAGQELLIFDRKAVADAGHPDVVVVIVLNADDYTATELVAAGTVAAGTKIIQLKK